MTDATADARGETAPRGWGRRRPTLVVAGALTIAMLGWQGWHISESYRAVAHKESGKCATKLVEEVFFAATLHGSQLDELEHGIAASTPVATPEGAEAWTERYAESKRVLDDTIGAACSEIKGDLLTAVEDVGATAGVVDGRAEELVTLLGAGNRDAAWAMIGGPEYTADRVAHSTAVDSLVSETRKHLEIQLAGERRSELISVSVAVGIFALALGAWGLFLRRIRNDQLRLAAEERQRRQAEEELLQAQKLDAMGKMAGEIAHDFNNLLTAIWGSATAARSHLTADHPAMTPITRIEEASAQANDVVSGLLAFSRRAPAQLEPVEVGTLIWQTGSLLQSMMPDAVELVIEAAPGGSRWVMADRTQLQQVLINMALNGRDAMPDGGRLTIRTRCSPDPEAPTAHACIEVIDTGVGMSPEVQARIFEPFFTTRASEGRGTGLGLAIVHGIISNHGGSVRVHTEPGHGSRFTVELPMVAPPAEVTLEAHRQQTAAACQNATVLLTEDHRHVREIMAETLAGAGFSVVQATTGDEMLTAFHDPGVDYTLVIADLDIPGPDGLECIDRIRAEGATVPALVVTGTSAPDLESRTDELTGVLRKPFAMSHLRKVAVKMCKGESVETERV